MELWHYIVGIEGNCFPFLFRFVMGFRNCFIFADQILKDKTKVDRQFQLWEEH